MAKGKKKMQKWKDNLSNNLALILTIISLIAAYAAVEARYAKAAQVQMVELRLDQKILLDRQDNIQSRMWKYEDRYPQIAQGTAPDHSKEEYRNLQKDYKEIERNLNEIQQQMGEQEQ